MRALLASFVLALVLGACAPVEEPSGSSTDSKPVAEAKETPTANAEEPKTEKPAEEPKQTPAAAPKKPMDTTLDKIAPEDTPKDGEEVGILDTAQGRIVIRFFKDKAPIHVQNWKDLAKKGFYDGTRFHRVIPGFMVQGGDPNSKSTDRSSHGTGGPGYTIPAEFNDIKHTRGIVSAARTQDPNSAGSQFFLMVATSTHLDGQYSVYGKVISGMGNVDKIVNLKRDQRDNPIDMEANKIIKASVEKWPLK